MSSIYGLTKLLNVCFSTSSSILVIFIGYIDDEGLSG